MSFQPHRSPWSHLASVAIALAALGACTTSGPARPTAPVYSGAERPDPSRPVRPGDPGQPPIFRETAQARNANEPRHLSGLPEARTAKRIAVLLPFNAADAEVRRQSRALYNAIELAVFDSGATDIVLTPKDTGADAQQAAAVADQAAAEGATAMIGPLFAPHVGPVVAAAVKNRAPVVAFSTDPAALNQGAFLMSLAPRAEVKRIVAWAASQGVRKVAMFGPDNGYGRTVEAALRTEAEALGVSIVGVEYYKPGDTSPQAAARRLATIVKAEDKATPGKVAVLLPERGVQLRSIAPLLPYFDVNTRRVRFLGIGGWNDPSVWKEPSLFGGAFVAPDPEAIGRFDARYRAAYGEAPTSLAGYGYDAGALLAALARAGQLNMASLQRADGFNGVNGLFRFWPDGSSERALAVMQVSDQGGAVVIVPAATTFGAS